MTSQLNDDLIQSSTKGTGLSSPAAESNPHLPSEDMTGVFSPIERQKPFPSAKSLLIDQYVWKLMPATSIGRAINAGRQRLVDAEILTAARDAYQLMVFVLHKENAWIAKHHEHPLSDQQAQLYTKLILRRAKDEPMDTLMR